MIGADLSTTALTLVVRSADEQTDLVSITPMRGVVEWHGQPAHDLTKAPGMLLEALQALQSRGWDFSQGGSMSFSVRQHDMVLLGHEGQLLCPALSWQFMRGQPDIPEVTKLRELGAEQLVGKIENRFILPKLMWVIGQEPEIKNQIGAVMATGDWICGQLMDWYFLSASDALSNGLLLQRDKTLAEEVISDVGLNPDWFPDVAQSGASVGTVTRCQGQGDWDRVCPILTNWSVYSSLGDNHATAVGCGLADEETIVVSAGTSGTVIRICDPLILLLGGAVSFEYYDQRLLLMMMPNCGSWYSKFKRDYFPGLSYKQMNMLAEGNTDYLDIPQKDGEPQYPEAFFEKLPEGKIASVQFSIAKAMVYLALEMSNEVVSGKEIRKIILTGGLSQSEFFREAFRSLVHWIVGEEIAVFVSSLEPPISSQTGAWGGLINATVGNEDFGSLEEAVAELCPIKRIP